MALFQGKGLYRKSEMEFINQINEATSKSFPLNFWLFWDPYRRILRCPLGKRNEGRTLTQASHSHSPPLFSDL